MRYITKSKKKMSTVFFLDNNAREDELGACRRTVSNIFSNKRRACAPFARLKRFVVAAFCFLRAAAINALLPSGPRGISEETPELFLSR
jgi:hypothetical protein